MPDQSGGKRWAVPLNEWTDFHFDWDLDRKECAVAMNGQDAMPIPMKHPSTNGISYLRLRSTANAPDVAGWYVESVNVQVKPTAGRK